MVISYSAAIFRKSSLISCLVSSLVKTLFLYLVLLGEMIPQVISGVTGMLDSHDYILVEGELLLKMCGVAILPQFQALGLAATRCQNQAGA